jgi:hypothetical protein
MMFVVRIAQLSGIARYKAFPSLDNAKRRFKVVEARIPKDFDGIALFEVADTDNPRKAVKAVKAGEAKLLERDLRSELLKDAGEVLDKLFAPRAVQAN